MKRIVKKTYKLKNFFNEDIWLMELEELSRAKARFIKHMKVLLITIKTFSAEKKATHYLLLIPRNELVNLNSLLYDLAAFNFTKFMIKDYDLAKRSVGGLTYISITTESYEETEWYERTMLAEPTLQGKITLDQVERVIISEENLKLIEQGKTWEEYKLWNKEFLR